MADKRKKWTVEEIEILRALYSNTPTARIAAQLKRGIGPVYQKAAVLRLQKSAEFFLDPANNARMQKGHVRGVDARFPKGNVPYNKGTRRPGFAPGRMAETQFKRGERRGVAARNWVPIGTIKTDCDGYLRIKVANAAPGEATGYGNMKVWPLLQRHVWQEHHGAIPDGLMVAFKDGDRTNCAIENLVLMSRADNARRNSMWANYPRELAEVIQLAGVLKRKLRKSDGAKHA